MIPGANDGSVGLRDQIAQFPCEECFGTIFVSSFGAADIEAVGESGTGDDDDALLGAVDMEPSLVYG